MTFGNYSAFTLKSKEVALANGIEVIQPTNVKDGTFAEDLRRFDADVFVVVAYGRILNEEVLNMPKYGCINVHASLLPKYRGAAPIQWAVIDGEEKTGALQKLYDSFCKRFIWEYRIGF